MLGKRIVLLALLTPDVPPHRLVDVLVHVTLQRHLQHVLAVPCRCCREGAAKYQRLCCMCARGLHFFRHVALCHSALRQRAVELLQVVRGAAGRRASEQDTAARVPSHIPCRTRATPLHQLRYGGHAAAEATTARDMLEFGVSTARWQQRQAHSTTHGERPVLVKQVFETFLELRHGLLVTWKATHSATHAWHHDAPSSRLLAAAVSATPGKTTSLRVAPEMQGDDGAVPTHKAQLHDTCVPSLYTVSSWRTFTVRRDE